MIRDYLSVAIHKELCKAPRNLLRLFLIFIEKLGVLTKIAIDIAGVRSIHFGFREKWELSTIKLSCKSFDFLVCSRLLVHELVAGECKNFKALISVFFMQLNKQCVSAISYASLRNYVNNKYSLFIF